MAVGSGADVGGCDRGDWDGDETVWEVELGLTGGFVMYGIRCLIGLRYPVFLTFFDR